MSDITLYELTSTSGGANTWSPFVWKTKVDLAILGVPVKTKRLNFVEIRGDLAKETGNDKITVPTLKVDGEYVSDSFVIAQWLERHHASGDKTLFPGGVAAAGLVRFVDEWANETLAAEMRGLIGPKVYQSLDEPARAYWIESRFKGDESKISPFVANLTNAEFVETKTAAARARLAVVEKLLAHQKSQGNGLWLAGKGPSHADAEVFGWYAFSRLNKELVAKVWEHDSLPLVREWIKAVTAIVGEEELP